MERVPTIREQEVNDFRDWMKERGFETDIFDDLLAMVLRGLFEGRAVLKVPTDRFLFFIEDVLVPLVRGYGVKNVAELKVQYNRSFWRGMHLMAKNPMETRGGRSLAKSLIKQAEKDRKKS